MNPWFETAGVALIALLGVILGVLSRRLRRPYWVLGCLLSLLCIAVLVVGRTTALHFRPPLCVDATRQYHRPTERSGLPPRCSPYRSASAFWRTKTELGADWCRELLAFDKK